MSATLPARLIIDTGPLVAWLDAADRHHAPVRDLLAEFQGELISTWPVLTEVCHLVPERLVPGFLRWVGAGGITVVDISTASAPALADRMDKYADLPMDLADASLLWLAETMGLLDILTLDRRDFGRTLRGQSLRNVLDSPARAKSRARRKPAR